LVTSSIYLSSELTFSSPFSTVTFEESLDSHSALVSSLANSAHYLNPFHRFLKATANFLSISFVTVSLFSFAFSNASSN